MANSEERTDGVEFFVAKGLSASNYPLNRDGDMGAGQGQDPWQQERETVLKTFTAMLSVVTGDGSRKRQAGNKQPWWKDTGHEAAIFSHLSKWKHNEAADKDSGTHPLVHLAWRALAIAYQEVNGPVDPAVVTFDTLVSWPV